MKLSRYKCSLNVPINEFVFFAKDRIFSCSDCRNSCRFDLMKPHQLYHYNPLLYHYTTTLLYYNTFSGRNYCRIIIRLSVCHNHSLPPKSNICMKGWRLSEQSHLCDSALIVSLAHKLIFVLHKIHCPIL
jgi:hypothetical protein